MTFFDLILILVVFGFVWFGFWYGLIYSLGRIISLVVGVIFASRWYLLVADKLMEWFNGNPNLMKIAAFIGILLVVWAIVFSVFKFLSRIFSHLPLIGFVNRLAGGLLGLAEGALVVGLLLYFSAKFPLTAGWAAMVAGSSVALFLINISKILLPLLPTALKQVESFL